MCYSRLYEECRHPTKMLLLATVSKRLFREDTIPYKPIKSAVDSSLHQLHIRNHTKDKHLGLMKNGTLPLLNVFR